MSARWAMIGVLLILLALLVYGGRRIAFSNTALAESVGPAPRPIDPARVPPTVVGMNLANVSSISSEWAFNDIIQGWGTLSLVTDHGWVSPLPPTIKTDHGGHPIDVPRGTQLVIQLHSGLKIPSGKYDCHLSPGWQLEPFGDGIIERSGNKFKLTIFPETPKSTMTIALAVRATDASSSLLDLSCMPVEKSKAGRFNPQFLADIAPFRVLRFMDWMRTNNAPRREWNQRTTPASFSQAGDGGVSLEDMVDLANTAKADPWFTLPFDASPEYYRAFAIYVRDHLNDDRKVYVELSNEVWNSGFQQSQAASAEGKRRYPSASDDALAGDYYYGDRVRDLMRIWSEVFGKEPGRMIRVLATQAAWSARADRILAHGQTWRSVDLLATAPYFGSNGFDVPGTGAARIEAIFGRSAAIVDQAIGWAHASKNIAAKYGLPYASYEGGPGFDTGAPEVAVDLNKVTRDPRMYDMYMLFLERWRKEIGGRLVVYTSVGAPGQYGSWGHMDYTGQPLADAPKMRALVDFINQRKK